MSALAVTGAALIAGCGTAPSAGALLPSAAPGYLVDKGATRTHLSAAQVAQVLPSDPVSMLRELKAQGFVSAASRAFRAPSGDFVLTVVVRLTTAAQATAVRDALVADVGSRGAALDPSTHGATGVFPTTGLPGATTFVVGGEDRARGQALFVQGVVFAVGPRVYVAETGGSGPANTADAERYATQLHQIAVSKEH